MKKIISSIAMLAIVALLSVSATVIYETNHKTAEVNMYQGIVVFTDCNPVMPFDNLGDVTVKSTGGFGDDTYNGKRDGAIKKLKKDFPNADGIIISFGSNGRVNAIAIKFK